jgi:phosphatidylserine synthase
MARGFRISLWGIAALTRGAAGVAVFDLGIYRCFLAAGIGLVLCVWLDAGFGRWAENKRVKKNDADIQLEGFADFLCFVLAPAAFSLRVAESVVVALAAAVFIVSGMWRIARFNVEGLKAGRYEGLPVTYNGYIFAALALISFHAHLPATVIFAPAMLILAAAMVSRKIRIPEIK